MKNRLKKYLLLALNACDGLPMPEQALISAAQNLARPEEPTDADVIEALKDLSGERYIQGVTDDMMDRTWTLTQKGVHKARGLR